MASGLYRPARKLYHTAAKLPQGGRNSWQRVRGAPDGQPLPPANLILTVAGTTDVEWFLHSGKLAFDTIKQVLEKNRIPLDSLGKVLDFGSGCGRVVRHWRGQTAQVFGTDYNAELVKWCAANLPAANFALNQLSPPLRYEDETFDLVYAVSVFTHLAEDLQFAWLAELRRIIRPGGLLFITLHGRYYLDETLNEAQRAQFAAGQPVVVCSELSGSNACNVYHPESYVRERMAEGFTIVDFVPEGALGNPRQDVYLLRKNA
jgi:SAM-dependent methyltransferase